MPHQDDLHLPTRFVRDKSDEFARRYPHEHRRLNRAAGNAIEVSRRRFFQVAGAGIAGSYLAGTLPAAETQSAGVTPRNTAKNAILIFLNGAMSQVDTLDLKVTSATPAALKPTPIGGIRWPMGLLPNLGAQVEDFAIVRSMSAWALVHSLAQTWSLIGRSPVAALGDIAPSVGSIVAIEKEPLRKPGQMFPAFLALNTPAGPGAGYLPASYGPFRVDASRSTTSTGVVNTVNPAAPNAASFNSMLERLYEYEGTGRQSSPFGTVPSEYDSFYSAARGMMYNAAVQTAFNFTAADSQRYGIDQNGRRTSTQFGNACLLAKQILAADQGTRFIQISHGSWDMHQNIYAANDPQSLFGLAPTLDGGLSALLADLKSSGMLSETLVVVVGEFGRTPGMSAAAGRDHYLLQSALFAGAGITGGKVIGATSQDGSLVTEFGWNGSGDTGPRYVRPEDMEATILDAMGIDWTTVRSDDPYGRGFSYVPFAAQGAYGPIRELWG